MVLTRRQTRLNQTEEETGFLQKEPSRERDGNKDDEEDVSSEDDGNSLGHESIDLDIVVDENTGLIPNKDVYEIVHSYPHPNASYAKEDFCIYEDLVEIAQDAVEDCTYFDNEAQKMKHINTHVVVRKGPGFNRKMFIQGLETDESKISFVEFANELIREQHDEGLLKKRFTVRLCKV